MGKPVESLYSDQLPRYSGSVGLQSDGLGLFVNGGNPLYYTVKGSPETIAAAAHAAIKQNAEDLGGQHVVFRTAQDPISRENYMHVHRVPLTWIKTDSSVCRSTNPAPCIIAQSKKSSATHGEFGWRSNLEATMRAENEADQLVNQLYPQKAFYTGTKWSCPLRRLGFWTNLVGDFNPMVPSPPRAARLFGEKPWSMTYGTRSHPTQLFRNLKRLATVHTSNGFCLCKIPQHCSVLETVQNSNCTLLQTIRSLYDQQYRRVELLLGPSSSLPCLQQLDWPFEGGTMRDGSVDTGRNLAQECNTVDRLPPFMYRSVTNKQ